MSTIFDLVKAEFIASYWTSQEHEETYLTQELFPNVKQLGLDLKWIKGSKGRPVVLKMSAFDAAAIPRSRIGFGTVLAQMPYMKESHYIDEELRQELNRVLESGNKELRDNIMTRVFDDEMRLLRGARARREQMRSMMLSTGAISIIDNGQEFMFDYGVTHKENAAMPWSDPASDPIEDIILAKETILEETGETLTRAMCDRRSFRNLRRNVKIMQTIFAHTPGQTGLVNDPLLKRFIMDETGLEVIVNENHFDDQDGTTYRYMPQDTFVMFPSGALGNTHFGTTPAESDLMGSGAANVSIVDTGVAITTATKVDPVNIETIVSQICLPSFERAESVFILDTGN